MNLEELCQYKVALDSVSGPYMGNKWSEERIGDLIIPPLPLFVFMG